MRIKRFRIFAIMVVTIGLSSCEKQSEKSGGSTEPQTLGKNMTDGNILAALGAVSRLELQIGMLAAEKAKSEAVRTYAKQTQGDHARMISSVDSLAKLLSTTIVAQNGDTSALHAEHIRNTLMRAESHHKFDSAYISLMVQVHRDALAGLASWKAQAAHNETVDYITRIVPLFEEHEKQAKSLSDGLMK